MKDVKLLLSIDQTIILRNALRHYLNGPIDRRESAMDILKCKHFILYLSGKIAEASEPIKTHHTDSLTKAYAVNLPDMEGY